MSRQVFRILSSSANRGCCLAAPRSRRGWFHPLLVAGASALRAGRHCSVCPRSSCREAWPTHTHANAIWPVSKKGQMPLFGLRVAVGVPGDVSCWKRCRFEASSRHLRISGSVGFPAACSVVLFRACCRHRRRRFAPPVNLGWVGCVALDAPFEFIQDSRIHRRVLRAVFVEFFPSS